MSSQRPGEKVVHQDYIARIRYSNALPPPPNPPKLLDIPGTGLSGGQYTSAGYASRLAREQPLNIEADAELGMPIDLIGIPGVFDGDERAISARPGQALHPADKALMRPLNSLGKANTASGSVSFLRRTEYSSSQQAQHFSSSTSKDLLRMRSNDKKRKLSINKDDPINIMRHIVKGFDIAYPGDAYKGEDSTENLRGAQVTDSELKAWSNPKHPSNPELKLLDSYPVLPDLDAIPSLGFYMVMKYQSNPSDSDVRNKYDERLDTAILRPVPDEAADEEFAEKLRAWQESNSDKPEPIREYDYDYYIPTDNGAVRGIKRKLDVNDPGKDDDQLYTDDNGEGVSVFKYKRLRTYETHTQHGDSKNYYNDSVALALHDANIHAGQRLQKGAYFYPIIQRTGLRPKRKTMTASQFDQDQKIDELNITIGEPGDDVLASQAEKRAALDPSVRVAEAAG